MGISSAPEFRFHMENCTIMCWWAAPALEPGTRAVEGGGGGPACQKTCHLSAHYARGALHGIFSRSHMSVCLIKTCMQNSKYLFLVASFRILCVRHGHQLSAGIQVPHGKLHNNVLVGGTTPRTWDARRRRWRGRARQSENMPRRHPLFLMPF